MRIVLANWARVSEGAITGGGVNGYAQQLALELMRRAHEVIWLSSGWSYIPDPSTSAPAACKVRRMEDFQGIRVFEVINSPVVAPGIFQQRDPIGELSAPALEAELARFFSLLEPDVVHFHNIEGFSPGCIDAARGKPPANASGGASRSGGAGGGPTWRGSRVLFSLHNYFTICPQVYLMKQGHSPCHNFEGGNACVQCIEGPDPQGERNERAKFHMRGITLPAPGPSLGQRLTQVFAPAKPIPMPAPLFPGSPTEVFTDLIPTRPNRPATSSADGPTPDTHPLSNDVTPDPTNAMMNNDFGRRRREMVAMLSRCDRVLAVSNFVRAKFESMGVSPNVIRAMPIGSRMTEHAAACPEVLDPLPPFDPSNPRPIRAVFMGYHNYYKGLPMLLDSLDLLTPSQRARLHLYVFAKDVDQVRPRLESLRPSLAGLSIRPGYQYDEVPSLLCGKDLGLVPSVWWDNGPQTVMEFFACGLPIVAAALGGIPDLVKHGHNGLLHKGNDRTDLARTLSDIIANPSILFDLRRNVRPPQSMPVHAGLIEGVYNECLRGSS